MGTLHTVNKSPFSHSTLRSCISVCADGDTLVLIEDGVFGAIPGSSDTETLIALIKQNIKVYALAPDTNARAIEKKIIPGIELINYDDFVKLSLEYTRIQSWY